MTEGAETVVYVIEAGRARRRVVEVIDWPAERIVVTAGLAEGDSVIADPTGLTDGQEISVKGE
jgi:hypothetical protein